MDHDTDEKVIEVDGLHDGPKPATRKYRPWELAQGLDLQDAYDESRERMEQREAGAEILARGGFDAAALDHDNPSYGAPAQPPVEPPWLKRQRLDAERAVSELTPED